jgi:hypothetical protein
MMAELGLGQPEINWHTVRDRIGEAGAGLEKSAPIPSRIQMLDLIH